MTLNDRYLIEYCLSITFNFFKQFKGLPFYIIWSIWRSRNALECLIFLLMLLCLSINQAFRKQSLIVGWNFYQSIYVHCICIRMPCFCKCLISLCTHSYPWLADPFISPLCALQLHLNAMLLQMHHQPLYPYISMACRPFSFTTLT